MGLAFSIQMSGFPPIRHGSRVAPFSHACQGGYLRSSIYCSFYLCYEFDSKVGGALKKKGTADGSR